MSRTTRNTCTIQEHIVSTRRSEGSTKRIPAYPRLILPPNTPWNHFVHFRGVEDGEPGGFGSLVMPKSEGS